MRQGFFLLAFAAAACWATGAGATNFAVLLGGTGSQEVDGCQSIDIDDITWDYEEIKTNEFPVEVADDLTLARKLKYKTYKPGQPHYGNARITADCNLGGSKELQAWFLSASRGGADAIRDVTCFLYFEDGKPNRTFNLRDCFPMRFTECTSAADGSSSVTLEVSIGSVQMEDTSNGRMRKRPELLYQAWDDTLQEYVTDVWDAWGGGDEWGITQRVPDSPLRIGSPGHKSVGEITLRGAMTDGRKALCQWINETVKGKPWKRSFSVIEVPKNSNGRKAAPNNFDSFITRYSFPRMSVTNTTGNDMERIEIKPIRVELK